MVAFYILHLGPSSNAITWKWHHHHLFAQSKSNSHV